MKVIMLEYYQGVRSKIILEPGNAYTVDSTFGAWLVEHHKANEVKPKVEKPEVIKPEVKKPVRKRVTKKAVKK